MYQFFSLILKKKFVLFFLETRELVHWSFVLSLSLHSRNYFIHTLILTKHILFVLMLLVVFNTRVSVETKTGMWAILKKDIFVGVKLFLRMWHLLVTYFFIGVVVVIILGCDKCTYGHGTITHMHTHTHTHTHTCTHILWCITCHFVL